MPDFKFTFEVATGEWERRMGAHRTALAHASTDAMDEVVIIVKREGRADIAQAGFSKRWQNALRVTRYPRKGISPESAAFIHHKIQYAGIFDEGANIKGKPLLWLPLSTTPKTIKGRATRPERLNAILGGRSRLVPFESPDGTPLLGARLRVLARNGRVGRQSRKVTLASLRRGDGEGTGVLRTIPLFFGIRETNVPKQFSIAEICRKASDRVPSLYAEQIAKQAEQL
jgi:hypothetical protein